MPSPALHLVQTTTVRKDVQHDGLLHMAKNVNTHPDVLIGDGNSIGIFGIPGSGKTTVMARLLEQFGYCGVPFSAFDLEGDLRSIVPLLPRGVLATADNCPSAQDMYKGGLQVIFDLDTFGEDRNHAARFISKTVSSLLALMKGLPQGKRVPFLVGLDEAAYWLPQIRKGKDYLESFQFEALFNVFHTLAIRGRKMGLVPLLCAQRIANLHKDVLSPGTYILMRQTTDTDLKRYMEYISASAFGDDTTTEKEMRARIAAFKRGQAVIKLPNGKQGLVQFYNRESEHTSHAPKTSTAQSLYRDVPFNPNRRYGAATFEEEAPSEVKEVRVATSGPNCKFCGKDLPESTPGGRAREYCNDACKQANHRKEHRGDKEQILRGLLAAKPSSTVSQLQIPTGYARSGVERIVARIQADEKSKPPNAPPPQKSSPSNTRATTGEVKRQVEALLSASPNLTVSQLVAETGGALSTVRRASEGYFARYPERRPGKPRSKQGPTIKEWVFSLLEADPSLTTTALVTKTGHPVDTMQKYRQEYFVHHPEKKPPPKMELSVRALLVENPNYTVGQIKYRTGYPSYAIRQLIARISSEGDQTC